MMLFKSRSWILFWTVNAYALMIENRLTGETLVKSSAGYSIYNFVTDDTLDIMCRREEGRDGTLGWALQSPETSKIETCETTDEESVRYRIILSSIDDKRKMRCRYISNDGLKESFDIVLNFTGSRLEREEGSYCSLATEFVCPNSLNRLLMNITVNGNVLAPLFENYLPAYEFVYNYNTSEDIQISCLAYGNRATYAALCAEDVIESNQHSCLPIEDGHCEVTAKIKLNEKTNEKIVHCYTSNENEPLATLRLRPSNEEIYPVSTEQTTSQSDVETVKTTTKEADESIDPLDDIYKPIFKVSATGFYILLGCTLLFFVITICFAVYTVCL